MAKAKSVKTAFYGTGRRKKSIARVRLVEGTGVITVNGKSLDEYFGTEVLKQIEKSVWLSYLYDNNLILNAVLHVTKAVF